MMFLGQKIFQNSARGRCGFVLGLALLLGACSAEESLPQIEVDRAPAAGETRAGTLLAEYTSPRTAGAGGVRVHAQFLDVQGIHYARALEALEVWRPDFDLGLDACEMHSAQLPGEERVDDIRLELLNVGPIRVRGPIEQIRLDARRLPDLWSTFSGVIYGTEQGADTGALRLGYLPGARYDFMAPGDGINGGFSVTLAAPRPIRIQRIGDEPADEDSWLGWDFDRDLRIFWHPFADPLADATAAERAAHRGEEVFLRISAGFGPDRPRLTCRLEDDGAFTLPAAWVQQLSSDSDELQLSLRRINARSVAMRGFDAAEFVFSTVDRLTLVDSRR